MAAILKGRSLKVLEEEWNLGSDEPGSKSNSNTYTVCKDKSPSLLERQFLTGKK